MAVEADTDRATLLADYGDTVSGPTGVADFQAIVDQRPDEETFDGESVVWVFLARSSDTSALNLGDELTVGASTFRIAAHPGQDNDGLRELVTVKQ